VQSARHAAVGLVDAPIRVRNLAEEQCLRLQEVLLAASHICHGFFQATVSVAPCSRHERSLLFRQMAFGGGDFLLP
jgi:hypothetical protein